MLKNRDLWIWVQKANVVVSLMLRCLTGGGVSEKFKVFLVMCGYIFLILLISSFKSIQNKPTELFKITHAKDTINTHKIKEFSKTDKHAIIIIIHDRI